MKRTITIVDRPPRNRNEARYYGQTQSLSGRRARIFVNNRFNSGVQLLDTVIHELIHAVLKLYQNKVNRRKEEKLCRYIAEYAVHEFKRCQRRR